MPKALASLLPLSACMAAGLQRQARRRRQKAVAVRVRAAGTALHVRTDTEHISSSAIKPQLSLRDFLLGLDHAKYLRRFSRNWAVNTGQVLECNGAGALQQIEEGVACHQNGVSRANGDKVKVGVESYSVVADWNDWDFDRMAMVASNLNSEEMVLEVQLPHAGGEFQIVCDEDWSRVLYPGQAPGSEVRGPDSGGHGMNWSLGGRAGDRFRLRLVADDAGFGVTWDLTEAGPLEDEPWSPLTLSWQEAVRRVEEIKQWGGDYRTARSEALKLCGEAGACEQALQLLEDIWSEEKQANEPSQGDYRSALRACELGGDEAQASVLRQEMLERGEEPQVERFCLTPRVYWHRDVRRMGCGASNSLDWEGGDSLPVPPTSRSWLLPASDTMAMEIALRQEALRDAGWRVLSCDPDVVRCLDDKVALQALARETGLSAYFPERFQSPELASYPCILKPAAGEFGAGVQITYSAEAVRRITRTETGELSSRWLLQELVTGCFEYSTSLLVVKGRILEKACIRYQYDADEYVWPQVTELAKELIEPPVAHLQVMETLVRDYSGFVNFNYKIRQSDQQLLIMEANARVGADLACDVPRPHACHMLELLDACHEE